MILGGIGMSRNRYTASYNHGSTAPKIDYEVYPVQVPNKPIQDGPRVQRKRERIQELKRKTVLIMCTVAVFGASVAFVWGCAIISHKQYELKQAKMQLRELKSQVNTTKSLIASSTNLDNIRARAINELNMAEPLPHQIIYLDIPKTSYTVVDLE